MGRVTRLPRLRAPTWLLLQAGAQVFGPQHLQALPLRLLPLRGAPPRAAAVGDPALPSCYAQYCGRSTAPTVSAAARPGPAPVVLQEFRRTKNDCGDCPAVHDEGCRAQWEALDGRSKERYG